ncbi:aspartyl protease family protein [Sphingomonas soli]|uniref:aspartyl protease family protein n=1 Tax=Sphingomonas soli TaxID=266127 RepID=UPI00082CDCCD|nr:aspartyl protease family protein [Sphingomonas soli]
MLPFLLALQVPVLAPESEARWVPFELTASNQIRFTMQVEGRDARAVLDTGVSTSLVTRSFAGTLGLKPIKKGRAAAIGGTVSIELAEAPRVSFGGLSRSGGRIAIADMPTLTGLAADIYIGADLLDCCALDIDYAARRFRILPSGRMPFTGDTAPLARTRGAGVYVTQISINGRHLRPILVDTGDGSSLTLTHESWAAVRPASVRLTTTLGYGAGGGVVNDMAILPGITLGGRESGEAEVRIEAAHGYSQTTGMAGRIGTGLLLGYRVLLDPRAGRMVLRSDPAAPTVVRSTSGMLVNYASGRLEILHVMRGSPAEAAGWRAGERICAADNVPIHTDVAADGQVDWTIGPPGKLVRLKDCDGRERPITLAQFY